MCIKKGEISSWNEPKPEKVDKRKKKQEKNYKKMAKNIIA